MDKIYVEFEQLENVLDTYVSMRLKEIILSELKTVTPEETVSELSVHEKRRLLDSDSDVVALQVWQRDDVIAAIKAKGFESPSAEMVDSVAAAARNPLEDCSDGWDKLGTVVNDCSKDWRV